MRCASAIAIATLLISIASCSAPGYDVSPSRVVFNEYTGNPLLPGGIVQRDVPQADAETFVMLQADPPYAKDAHNAYFGRQTIVGADPATLHPFGDSHYAADKSQVFFEETLVAGADVSSFKPYGFRYGSDANHTYHNGRLLEGVQGIVTPFANEQYFRDEAGNIFYWTDGFFGRQKAVSLKKVDICDLTTFEMGGAPTPTADAHDRVCTYVRGSRAPTADTATYQDLRGGWWKDANGVYFGAAKLQDVDPDNFEVVQGVAGTALGRDGSGQCWYGNSPDPSAPLTAIKSPCPASLVPF